MKKLGIKEEVANTKIGDVLQKTISGGERKRTSIGVELITDPSILLLDEPTSGLDSFNAFKIVKLLHDISKTQNKTILSTIHQPSSASFAEFDQLLLMMDGYIVYQGKAKYAIQYFNRIGFDCPKFANPADFLMKKVQVNYPKSTKDELNVKILVEKFNDSQRLDIFQLTDAELSPD